MWGVRFTPFGSPVVPEVYLGFGGWGLGEGGMTTVAMRPLTATVVCGHARGAVLGGWTCHSPTCHFSAEHAPFVHGLGLRSYGVRVRV